MQERHELSVLRKTSSELKVGFFGSVVEERAGRPVTVRANGTAF